MLIRGFVHSYVRFSDSIYTIGKHTITEGKMGHVNAVATEVSGLPRLR